MIRRRCRREAVPVAEAEARRTHAHERADREHQLRVTHATDQRCSSGASAASRRADQARYAGPYSRRFRTTF